VVRAPDLPEPKSPAPTGEIHSGVLPSGHYATLTHIGPPSELMEATKRLLEWAAGEGLEWDVTPLDGVEHWGCRMESYKTDPRVEPDTGVWETELAFRLADLAPPTAGSGRPRP
jgi:effector-binding domain-containing protein